MGRETDEQITQLVSGNALGKPCVCVVGLQSASAGAEGHRGTYPGKVEEGAQVTGPGDQTGRAPGHFLVELPFGRRVMAGRQEDALPVRPLHMQTWAWPAALVPTWGRGCKQDRPTSCSHGACIPAEVGVGWTTHRETNTWRDNPGRFREPRDAIRCVGAHLGRAGGEASPSMCQAGGGRREGARSGKTGPGRPSVGRL